MSAFIDELLNAPAAAPVARPVSGVTCELRIRRFVFKEILDKAATVVPTRDVAPVLKNVQIVAKDGRLRVAATDTELSMVASTELVEILVEGTCVLPAKRMLDILKEAGEFDVHLRVCGTSAAITIGRTTWNQVLATGADFPDVSAPLGDTVLTAVGREAFAFALGQVRYAACRDANRANLMMISIAGDTMTAADGARFARIPTEPLGFDCQIPIDAVDDLLRLLKNHDLDEIGVGQTPTGLIFTLGTDTFIVTTLLSEFPDLEAQWLRPALANKHILNVNRAELLSAIRRVRISADTNTSAIALSLSHDLVTVAARDKYRNAATEAVQAHWAGGERTLVVNHAYLTDALTHHASDWCAFALGDDTRTRKSPVLLRDADTGGVAVLQQMNLDWSA